MPQEALHERNWFIMPAQNLCPNCETGELQPFYDVANVPAHSVLLLETREEALFYPRGNIRLGLCNVCGFISNILFDTSLHEYSARYEETQGYSETFNAFARELAQSLIERYDIHGRNVLEIGCGKGEFIVQICELGGNHGIGIDPAYVANRSLAQSSERVSFITDFYSEQYAHLQADFVICKMTLEHIPRTLDFVRMIRRTLTAKPDTVVFFQVPDVTRILKEQGFWDIYYEHCSYFTAGSLARLFRRSDFDLLGLSRGYGDQYLLIEARPGSGQGRRFPELEDDLETNRHDVLHFQACIETQLQNWRTYVRELHGRGGRIVLWGSGSKGVAFLTTLGVTEEIIYTVDINPNKHGHYMAGSGQEIVAPAFLATYQPDVVIAMNPLYCAEIQRELDHLNVRAELIAIDTNSLPRVSDTLQESKP